MSEQKPGMSRTATRMVVVGVLLLGVLLAALTAYWKWKMVKVIGP